MFLILLALLYSCTIFATPFKTSNMSIALMAVGTRGDLDPFIAIGLKLHAEGHRIRIASHEEYRKIINSHSGLEFYPLKGDPAKLSSFMVDTKGSLLPSPEILMSGLNGNASKMTKMVEEILFSTWGAATELDPLSKGGIPFKADALICNPPANGCPHICEKLGINCHIAFPQPWLSTKAMAHPLSGSRFEDYGKDTNTNLNSYSLIDNVLWFGMKKMTNKFRKKIESNHTSIGLRGLQKMIYSIPHSFLWSSHLIPKPKDWKAHVVVTGTIELPRDTALNGFDPNQKLPKLVEFLKNGSPPIFVGFGSMVFKGTEKLREKILTAALKANVRVILQSGWANFFDNTTKLPECDPKGNVCFITQAPHSWLFDQCSAVVHHGGAGTTAAGLLAGKATMIVPFFGDQYLWGAAVAFKGVGAHPLSIEKLTVDTLAKSFIELKSTVVQEKAKALGKLMKYDRGVDMFVRNWKKNLNMRIDVDFKKLLDKIN